MGRSKAGFCHAGRVEQGKVGTLRTARMLYDAVSRNPTSGAFPWQYPRLRRLRPSIFPACLLAGRRGGRPGARTVSIRGKLRSERRAPRRPRRSSCGCVRPANEFARDVMGACHREPGRWRFPDRAGWAELVPGRGDADLETIMTSLGPVTYRRARYRSGASGASPVPAKVDESAGPRRRLPDAVPAAELGLLMPPTHGHCTARLKRRRP